MTKVPFCGSLGRNANYVKCVQPSMECDAGFLHSGFEIATQQWPTFTTDNRTVEHVMLHGIKKIGSG